MRVRSRRLRAVGLGPTARPLDLQRDPHEPKAGDEEQEEAGELQHVPVGLPRPSPGGNPTPEPSRS